MASLRKTENGSFIACFRWRGKQYQRGLATRSQTDARRLLTKITDRLSDLARGDKQVPSGVSLVDYVVHGENAVKIAAAITREANAATHPPLRKLIEEYLLACQGLKAQSSLGTERCHLNNLIAALGSKADLPAHQLTGADLERVQQQRLQHASPATVRKERQTTMAFFAWAQRTGYVESSIAILLPTVKLSGDNPPFRTMAQVEEILARDGLSAAEQAKLWDCLFLTQVEIGEILKHVRERGAEDFILPLFALAAFTGMRRGEILRLRWLDVNFESRLISARSQKQSRQKRETTRDIDMHPELESILSAYRQLRPKGQWVIGHATTLGRLEEYAAHALFQRTLRGTRWERTIAEKRKKVVIGFHTLRHSFASNLAMLGVDQRVIDRWMGHQTEEMRRRYQHLFPAARRSAIEALSYV